MHGITRNDYKIEIPSLETFDDPYECHKFCIVDFHKNYDGLIGSDLLSKFKAKLDYDREVLETQYATIPFYLNKSVIHLSPRTRQIIKVPTKESSGERIMEHTVLMKGVEIPNALVTLNQHEALVEVANFNEYPVQLMCNYLSTENFDNTLNEEIVENSQEKSMKSILNKLRLSHLNSEERKTIINLILKYQDIIYDEDKPLTFSSQVKHEIKLTNENPIYQKPYRKPYAHKIEIDKQINKMLEQDIIRPSNSPWASPITLVPKKIDSTGERKWRLVIDYRRLNENTVKDKYPLPNINEILDKLGRANYFSTLDLASGYHQIEMKEEDKSKTAFITDKGLFEFNRLAFGLCNAPSTFQRAMNNILRGLTDEICQVYLDDIVIYSTSLQEHRNRLERVFQKLSEHGVKINLNKCEFLKRELKYLGHLITDKGVKPDPSKIEAIKKYPIPKTKTEIKSFTGLLGYYRRFIKDYAKILKPMTKCLAKDEQVIIDKEYKECFEKCKNLLSNDPILQYPDFTKPFIVTTDASNYAIGAVLSQGPIGRDKPVAYASRTLSKSEIKYSTIEKEFLSIIYACKQFRPYIFGTHFTIVTDHKPLLWLHKLKDNNLKLQRWKVYLQEYQYTILYKKGKANSNADALSRIKLEELNINESVIVNEGSVESDDNNSLNSNVISEHEEAIPITQDPIDTKPRQFFIYSHHLPTDIEITLGPTKIYKFYVNRNNAEKEIIQLIKDYAQEGKIHVYCNDEIYKLLSKIYLENFNKHALEIVRCMKRVEIIKNPERQIEIVIQNHEGKSNHRGIAETIERIKRNFYWKHLDNTVSKIINNCEICQKSKYDRRPENPPIQITDTPSKPLEVLHIDLFRFDRSQFLTIIDKFSKFAQAYEVKDRTAITISKKLIKHFSRFGIPKEIISDSGTEFANKVMAELMKLYKIKLHIGTTGHHESNAIIERFHSTLIEHLRILKLMDNSLKNSEAINRALIAYNSTINPINKHTPFEILFGRTNATDPSNLAFEEKFCEDFISRHKNITETLYENIRKDAIKMKIKIADKTNKNKTDNSFAIGTKVFWKHQQKGNKTKTLYQGPYIINKILEHNKYEIKPQNETSRLRTKIVHQKELKTRLFTDVEPESRS